MASAAVITFLLVNRAASCVNRFTAQWEADLIHLFINLIILIHSDDRMIRCILASLLVLSAFCPTLNSKLEP